MFRTVAARTLATCALRQTLPHFTCGATGRVGQLMRSTPLLTRPSSLLPSTHQFRPFSTKPSLLDQRIKGAALMGGEEGEKVLSKALQTTARLPNTVLAQALVHAAAGNHTEIFKMLWAFKDQIAPAERGEALVHAASYDNREMIDTLLAEHRTLPPASLERALTAATVNGHIYSTEKLAPFINTKDAVKIFTAAATKIYDLLKTWDLTLSQTARTTPAASPLPPFAHSAASRMGQLTRPTSLPTTTSFLPLSTYQLRPLSTTTPPPSSTIPQASHQRLRGAALLGGEEGKKVITEILQTTTRLPDAVLSQALIDAASGNHTEIFKILWTFKDQIAPAERGEALVHAASYDNREMVDTLLAEHRTLPSASLERALMMATVKGHVYSAEKIALCVETIKAFDIVMAATMRISGLIKELPPTHSQNGS